MMSSSSKEVCVRAPVEIGPDEWSLITGHLFDDAFESACDLENMSRVCRSWREVGTWSDWSKAFGFFPLGEQFPSVLVPIMECARANGHCSQAIPWTIHREAAKKYLRLDAKSWRNMRACKYDLSRKAGDKYLYRLGDVLREATVNFRLACCSREAPPSVCKGGCDPGEDFFSLASLDGVSDGRPDKSRDKGSVLPRHPLVVWFPASTRFLLGPGNGVLAFLHAAREETIAQLTQTNKKKERIAMHELRITMHELCSVCESRS